MCSPPSLLLAAAGEAVLRGAHRLTPCAPLPPCSLLLQVKQFYTAPTAIRSLMRSGDDWVSHHSSRASLTVLGTVGEPINPEAWRWYHEVSAWACLGQGLVGLAAID
jgi:hypothetical protein